MLKKLAAVFQAKDALEFYDGAGHTVTRTYQDIVFAGIYMFLNTLLGMVVGLGHQGAGFTGFGMGVTNKRPYFPVNPLFDGCIQTAAGNPVGIKNFLHSIR